MLVASVSAVEGAARAATTGGQGGPNYWCQLWTRRRYNGLDGVESVDRAHASTPCVLLFPQGY